MAAAVVAVVAGAAFLLLRDGTAQPARDHLTVGATSTRPSVLVDVRGAVLEEFSDSCGTSRYPYLCARVRSELLAADAGLLTRGGLTIRTTVDQRLQQAAQQAVDRYVGRDDPQVAQQAMIVPGSGEIRAMATSRDEGRPLQQGGTAMVYPLVAALEQGLRQDDGFPYSDRYQAPTYQAFKNCKGENVGDPAHSVVNEEGDHGEFTTLRSGTWTADSTFFLKLTERVGLCETVEAARRLGLERADGSPLIEFETFVLGNNEVDPVSVATTYATLAARGQRCAPRAVTEIRNGSGVVRSFPPRCEQVLDQAVADAVTGVLAEALDRSPLKSLGRDAAGMIGTADDHAAAWYAGYTPDLASAVGLGGTLTEKMIDVTIGGRRYPYVDGLSIPGPIWRDSMAAALEGTPASAFTKPDPGRFGGCRTACAAQ